MTSTVTAPGTAADDAGDALLHDVLPRPGVLALIHRLRSSTRFIYATMLLSALVSLTASLVLSIDAVKLAADPDATLACDINATISCGTVAQAWQASLLGFPNAFLGLMAEPVVITLAVAALGGVRFPRWFMFSAQVVYTIGLAFAYWLFAQSMFVIGALCPWCLLVTISTTLVFTSLTHVNVLDDNLFLPRRLQARARAAVDADVDFFVVTAWLVLLVTAIVAKYGTQLLA
jgi:uncharacterized membrane protein